MVKKGRDLAGYLYEKFRPAFPMLVYLFFYLIWFFVVEHKQRPVLYELHSVCDDMIPFCEAFIIPYFMWFPYMIVTAVYILFNDKESFRKLSTMLIIGMTLFLVVSTLFPNGQYLRPAVMPRNNIFTKAVEFLYRIDTPTNIFPSIHVYNSLCIADAFQQSRTNLAGRKSARKLVSWTAAVIIMSTMFLKQHSVIDVSSAFILFAFIRPQIYGRRLSIQTQIRKRRHETVRI